MQPADTTFAAFRDYVDAHEVQGGDRVDLAPVMLIECPDDGRQVAFRGKCPRCAGASWLPAAKVKPEKPIDELELFLSIAVGEIQ